MLTFFLACNDSCTNGRCILKGWRCNGVDNCGDFSDERMCNSTSPPTPSPKPEPRVVYSGGKCLIHKYKFDLLLLNLFFQVNGWLVFLFLVPFAFSLGVAATIFGPPLLRRFRGGRYTEFQDFSEVS